MTPNEIIFLVIAIAFVVLVVFIALVAVAAYKSINKLTQTLNSLQKQIDDLDHGPRTLIHNANAISDNLKHKMKCLDPVFHSISNIGEGFEHCTAKYKESQLLKAMEEKMHQNPEESKMDNVAEVIEFALRGINLWQKFKKK